MVSKILLFACIFVISCAAQKKKYNILSLDAAKYKGLMTARAVDYMELLAYNIAYRDIPCFKKLNDENAKKPRKESRI